MRKQRIFKKHTNYNKKKSQSTFLQNYLADTLTSKLRYNVLRVKTRTETKQKKNKTQDLKSLVLSLHVPGYLNSQFSWSLDTIIKKGLILPLESSSRDCTRDLHRIKLHKTQGLSEGNGIQEDRAGQASLQQQSHTRGQRQRSGCQHNCLPRLPRSQKPLVGKYHLPLASGSCDCYPKRQSGKI